MSEAQAKYYDAELAKATGQLFDAIKEIDRLRNGIRAYLDGDYGRYIPRKVDTCQHKKFGWEACENCIDEYFAKLLHNPQ